MSESLMNPVKKNISIVSPCFNEEGNVLELYRRIKAVAGRETNYNFEFILIDNSSTDTTVEKLRVIAGKDPALKVIVNTRNFGHIRSPYYGILQGQGDAVIYLASDLQDPPEVIPQFIREWEGGSRLVMAVRRVSKRGAVTDLLRKLYYRFLDSFSETPVLRNANGFGLYDKAVLDQLRAINDPYPFLRGLICELGWPIKTIFFDEPRRMSGISKSNFYALYDIALLGLISHSLVPIRIISLSGGVFALLSVFGLFLYLVAGLFFLPQLPLGAGLLVASVFFVGGVLLLCLGVLGEYIGAIHRYVSRRPIVVERERINFREL